MRKYSVNLETAARRAIAGQIQAGAEAYQRAQRLPAILPIMPGELEGPEPALTRRIVLKLARALREERQRGKAGHWTYDLNRHLALAQAYRAESNRLRQRARTQA